MRMETPPKGRPRKFETVEEFIDKANEYFDSITLTSPMTKRVLVGYSDLEQKQPIYEEEPVLNNLGNQIMHVEYFDKPSVIGLCAYLQIDRSTLKYMLDNPILDKDGNELQNFSNAIKMAKERIEKYKADQLDRTQGQVTGIIFDLKYNHGWVDKTEVEINDKRLTVVGDIDE